MQLASPAGFFSGHVPEDISILLPAYNEAQTIESVVRDFHRNVATPLHSPIIVCEDGSTDGTKDVLARLAQELPVEVVSDAQRMGYAGGVKRGLLLTGGNAIFFSDSDGQYDPQDFWKLLNDLPEADMVIGCKVKREEPFHRILLARGFHVLARTLLGVRLRDMDCGFRIIRRSYVNAVVDSVMSLPYSFWAEFTMLGALRGFRIKEVPISHRGRLAGGTSIYQLNRLPRIIWAQFFGLLRLRRRMLAEGVLSPKPKLRHMH
jgi:glycosyltransferase involved in cell wall biosynthesis